MIKTLLAVNEILPWLLNYWPAVVVSAVTFLLLFYELRAKKKSRQKS